MGMGCKLVGIQGNDNLGGIGNFQDGASAEPIHLLFDLFGRSVGKIAGNAHKGRY